MNFSTIELELCKAWAKENSEVDDPLDVFHWKLLEVGREKAEKSARFHERTVADTGIDMASLSMLFYESDGEEPDGDENVKF